MNANHESTEAGREYDRALIHFRRREIPEAFRLFQRALSMGQDPGIALGERWACAMLLGRFEDAWAESDRLLSRVNLLAFNQGRPLQEQLVWNGTSLAGKSVLVRCHHGLGDTIQFLRFLPALRKIAARVAILGQGPLLPFLAPFVDDARALGEPEPPHEISVEVMELAQALRLGPAAGAPCPYLAAPEESVSRWRARLSRHPGLKVGLAWNVKGFKPERSLAAETLAGLAGIPGVSFFCLQKFAPPAEHALLQQELNFLNPEGAPDEIVETAALVANLDVVITVDTMVAHLAGALNKRAWVLLHPDADWRWMLDRSDTPWYPSLRLFRQDAATNESSLLAHVREELGSLAAGEAS